MVMIAQRALYVILLLFVASQARRSSKRNMKPILIVSSLGQCHGKENLPVFMENIEILQREKNKYYINGQVNFTRAYPEGFNVQLTIQKCKDPVDKHTCTLLLNGLSNSNVCDLLTMRIGGYQIFLEQTVPRLRCPIPKGIWRFPNIPVGNELLKYVPSDNTFYDCIIEGYDHDKHEMIICVNVAMHMRVVRGDTASNARNQTEQL